MIVARSDPVPREPRDGGRALIEVIVLGILVLIPAVYIAIAILRVQAATLAVNQAARDAGRAIDNAPTLELGVAQAKELAALALTDQHVPVDRITVEFRNPGDSCTGGAGVLPDLRGGAEYDICVTAVITFPGVPTVLSGERNTVTGVYTLHVGEFRAAG